MNRTGFYRDSLWKEEHLSIFKQMHDEMGEFKAELLIQSKGSGQRLRIFLELEPVEPYLISGLSIKEEKM